MLCFGFSISMLLITDRCFSCCWVMFIGSQGLFQLPWLCGARRCTQSWEGAWLGPLTATGQRDSPCHETSSCSGYKLRGGLRGAGRCSETGWTSFSGWSAVALCITWFVYSGMITLSSFAVFMSAHKFCSSFSPCSSSSHPGWCERAAAWC